MAQSGLKRLQTAAVMAAVTILLVGVLAAVLQPWLPWLFAVFVFVLILRLAVRD